MKKIHLAAALIAALSAPSAFAQPTDRTGFFIEGRGGSASVSEDEFDDTSTAFQFNGGYRWGAIGIEGGYSTFNDFEDSDSGLDKGCREQVCSDQASCNRSERGTSSEAVEKEEGQTVRTNSRE